MKVWTWLAAALLTGLALSQFACEHRHETSSAAPAAGNVVTVSGDDASGEGALPACCAADGEACDDPANCPMHHAADEESEPPACCSVKPGATDEQPAAEQGATVADGHDGQSTPTAHEAADPSRAMSRAGEWLEPDAREPFYLDFRVTTQQGKATKLAELVGKPMAVSFIFTRCPNPNMCPLITLSMAHLQNRTKEAGLAEKVQLVLISYDPAYDTPARLKAYGAERGLSFDNAVMLRPHARDHGELMDELGVTATPGGTPGDISHYIELLLIDRQGRFVRDYLGGIWDAEAVLADLEKLAAEPAG